MSPADARIAQLCAHIRRDWELVEGKLAMAQSVDPADGDPEAALVALSLDHAYQAFESILVRTERALGLAERSGERWHAGLLAEAGVPLKGVRPPIYPVDVGAEWRELLAFRHFLRHAYGVELDPTRLVGNRGRLDRAVAATAPFVRALLGALEA